MECSQRQTAIEFRESFRPWLRNQNASFEKLFETAWYLQSKTGQLLVRLRKQQGDIRELISALLLLRSIEHFEACLCLTQLGLDAPAKVSLRTLLETYFTIKAISSNEQMLTALILEGQAEALKLIRKCKEMKSPKFQDKYDPLLEKQLEEKAKESGSKIQKTEEIAKAAGLHELYLGIYSQLTGAVHTKLSDLVCYLHCDKEQIEGYSCRRNDSEAQATLLTAGQVLIYVTDEIQGMLHDGLGDERQALLEFFSTYRT